MSRQSPADAIGVPTPYSSQDWILPVRDVFSKSTRSKIVKLRESLVGQTIVERGPTLMASSQV
jgi:hypothetical protein